MQTLIYIHVYMCTTHKYLDVWHKLMKESTMYEICAHLPYSAYQMFREQNDQSNYNDITLGLHSKKQNSSHKIQQ